GPVLPIDKFPIEQLIKETLIIFVVATTGNGDEPDNMKKTWKFLLRKSLPTESLQGLTFALLGLGDSSYVKFNFAAKKLNKRLLQLGAKALIPIGLCDDQHDHGPSAVSLPWITNLWMELEKLHFLKRKQINDPIYKWQLKILENTAEINLVNAEILRWSNEEESQIFTLTTNLRTTSEDHFQDVRLLSFTHSKDVNWQPGDVLQLRPCNSDANVSAFFELIKEHNINFNANTIIELSTIYEDMPLPEIYAQPISVGMLAKYVWDLTAKPRPRAFELLALNCEDELEKEKLAEFTTAEGLDSVISYINRPRRTILEVLQDFRHATSKLTLPILCELFGTIQTRSFSIASIPEEKKLDILVAIVEYKTILSTPRLGLCSNWLKALAVDSKIVGTIKSGTMSLPKNKHTPIIMVGPGTGIAPFRSVIQSRLIALKKYSTLDPKLVVFFGCRNKSKDFHFSTEFENWLTRMVKVFVAFSRDQEEKVYVQHLIKQQKSYLKELILNEEAIILVAGSSNNMPKAVKEAFTFVLDENSEYIEQMIKNRRYQEETWS
ncbi:NADPH-dependent diflavin oxidoreductase 1-like, partial [Teleopsis dalmanni]|uniref:NADPH-dependent diflavin oxidoreductase 1-like n=1 Tax=Teleopsis dalmanni TaxID=139649 RepID=UPI0018CCF681